MFVKIENWDDDTPLILNVDNILAIHRYMGEAEAFKDCWEVIFNMHASGECRYLITQEQYTALCEILTKRL